MHSATDRTDRPTDTTQKIRFPFVLRCNAKKRTILDHLIRDRTDHFGPLDQAPNRQRNHPKNTRDKLEQTMSAQVNLSAESHKGSSPGVTVPHLCALSRSSSPSLSWTNLSSRICSSFTHTSLTPQAAPAGATAPHFFF